ncbi:uncharacterized protein LOC144953136 isoform X2 [Lampetra fluviatilis]
MLSQRLQLQVTRRLAHRAAVLLSFDLLDAPPLGDPAGSTHGTPSSVSFRPTSSSSSLRLLLQGGSPARRSAPCRRRRLLLHTIEQGVRMSAGWAIKREVDEHPGWKTAPLGGGALSREDDVAAGAVVAPSLRLKRRGGDSGGPVSGALLEVKLEGSDSRHRADIRMKEEEAEVFGSAKERLKLVDGEYRPGPRDLHVVEAGLRFPRGVLWNPAADRGSATRPQAPWTGDAAAVAASSSGSAEIEVILEDDDVSPARRHHTGRRTGSEGPQHRCPVCGKCYRHASKLRSHARVHTGEKPLACHVCGKAFAWPSGLRYHLVLHQGGRVLACPVCGTSFVRSSDLYAHVSSHHAPLPQQKQQQEQQQQKQQQPR